MSSSSEADGGREEGAEEAGSGGRKGGDWEKDERVTREERAGMECVVCSDSFRRLKKLGCGHAFCPACLERLSEGSSRIRCPYCRAITELTPFGVGDLPAQYSAALTCSQCRTAKAPINDCQWCVECKNILCRNCAATRHTQPPCALEPAASLGPVHFCIHQLDKFSAIHTKLTLIQKALVR